MMKLTSILTVLATILSCSVALANPLWTENFDNGVGRFNITTGQGDSVFVYDPVDGNLNGTFVRRIAGLDRRLAPLGRTYSETDVASFSFEWTPLQSDRFPWPSLGFFNLTSNQHITGIKALNSGQGAQTWTWFLPDGSSPGIPDLGWNFGDTYLLDFEVDGPALTLAMAISIWNGSSFDNQLTTSIALPNMQYEFDALGMGNIVDPSGEGNGDALVADIDNFSFTPEPSTALMLGAASLLALRRCRAA